MSVRAAASVSVRAAASIVVALCGVVLGGCGALGASSAGSPSASKLAQAQATHEYPTAAPAQSASGAAGDPVAAIRTFANQYINWSADDVAARMRDLAARSVGQARSAMQLAAAETAHDYELRRGGISNHGSVEAIAPLSGRPDRYVVVTREQTSATGSAAYQGLRPAWHVAIATVVQLATGGWTLSGWQPQS